MNVPSRRRFLQRHARINRAITARHEEAPVTRTYRISSTVGEISTLSHNTACRHYGAKVNCSAIPGSVTGLGAEALSHALSELEIGESLRVPRFGGNPPEDERCTMTFTRTS